MKNSRSEDFLLAKHTSHKQPHHVEPFSRLAAWFPWMNTPHLQAPLWKGLDEASIEGFRKKYKVNEKLVYFYCLSVNYNNRSPAVGKDSQKGIHCCRRAAAIYKLNQYTLTNNIIARLNF